MYLYINEESITNKNWVSNVNTLDNMYFYHLMPKGADLRNGITTLQWQYENDKEMFRNNSYKYRNRLCDGWGIYPGRDPKSLTDKEVADGIKKFRRDYKDGMNRIYMFRFPPYKGLGPQMRDILNYKDLYRINLSSKNMKYIIKDIDWGYRDSNTDNDELSFEYYRDISIDEYFKTYTEDTDRLLFSFFNHISIIPKYKRIEREYIEKINMPETIRDVKRLEYISI